MSLSRRSLLGFGAVVPLVAVSAARAMSPEGPDCYDPAKLPLSQRNRRRSLGYVEPSNMAGKACSACAFFTAATPASCGTCQLLSGGPVNANAVCSSFGAKAR